MDKPTNLVVTDELLLTLQRTLTLYTLLGYTPSLEELRYYLEHGYIPGNAPDWPRVKFDMMSVTSNVWVVGPRSDDFPRRVTVRSEEQLMRKATNYLDHIYYVRED